MSRKTGLIVLGFALAGLLALLMRDRTGIAERLTPEDGAATDDAAAGPTEPHVRETDAFPLPDPLVDPEVEVRKTDRVLVVYSDGRPAKTYRMVLGSEPVGDKEREGDRRTPEGEFYVCTKNAQSQYHRSIGLSYPDAEDAERGLAAGLISKREHRTILDAVRHLKQPPWNTALGGEIMIHGGGVHTDWTAGCIALADTDIEEIFNALPLGTKVAIIP